MSKDAAPSGITAEMFRQWRKAVRGSSNPQPMTNPVWSWLIESGLSAWQANEIFAGDSAFGAGAGWCFDRFGQSQTVLADGRTVFIGGEHEDYYDPDFFVYNDVTIVAPGAEAEILGYPTDVFPPTDFHSATLLDDHIVIIGNLGYRDDRRGGVTQVLTLDCNRWQIARRQTVGQCPGWIHRHRAELVDNARAIVVTGGQIDRCDGKSLVENIDEWRLNIADWRWERLSARRWPRFEVYREDKGHLHLWLMRQALFSKEMGWDEFEPEVQRLETVLGGSARLDMMPALFRPDVPHESLPEDENEHNVHRIRIGEVVVRYVEDMGNLQVTIEGELPAQIVELLRHDLTSKLQALELSPIAHRDIAWA